MAQRLKRLPGMQETWVQSLSWEDPLEKEMATHSSTLAWRIPWREEPGRLQSMGSQRDIRPSDFTFIKRLFSCSSLSAVRVVSSVYLRFLIFLPSILIPACAPSSPAFHLMCSAYVLNKQGDNIQP